MLGTIIGIEENNILVKLSIDLTKFQSVINLYVKLDDGVHQCVGEIVDVKEGIAYVNLLGEIIDNKFVFGVIAKPSFGAQVTPIKKENVKAIIGEAEYKENEDLYLGKSAVYNDVDVNININKFFSNHFAIFGSTGSGKSCSVARIFQNLYEKPNSIAYRSSVFIFDAYGEY